MRVLKEASENNKLPTMEVSCTGVGFKDKGCGRLLEAGFTDIHSDYSTGLDGSKDEYYFIICPKCGAKTEVYMGDIPEALRRLL